MVFIHNDRMPNFVPTMLAIIFNKFTPKHASSFHCEPLFIIIFFKLHAHAHKKTPYAQARTQL
jgi:hypothetical protein